MTSNPSGKDVLLARTRLADHVVHTPMVMNAAFSEIVGRRVYVKAENLQHAGSFKYRGAMNALLTLSDSTRKCGVITASSGNRGLVLATAGRHFGAPVTVVLPETAPQVVRLGIEHRGGQVITYDRTEGGPEAITQGEANRRYLTVIESAAHRWAITGAGTVAVEMLEDVPDLRAILVPVGGGALAAGVAMVAAQTDVIGVEPGVANDTARSIFSGEHIRIDPPLTIADGLAHTTPPDLTLKINRKLLSDVITVPESAIADAMTYLWRYWGLKAEPSGAVAFAGLVQALDRLPPGPVGVVLSGGNVDWHTYKSLLASSMKRTDPYADPYADYASVLH